MSPVNAVMGALRFIPATLARKALGKVSPKFNNYFASIATYGLDVNRGLDYLADKFERDSKRRHKEQLEQGATNHTLRPDEMAHKAELANQGVPGKIARSVASAAIGGYLGGTEKPAQPPMKKGAKQPTENQQETIQQPTEEASRMATLPQNRAKQKEPGMMQQVGGQVAAMAPEASGIRSKFPELFQAVEKKIAQGNPLDKAADSVSKSATYKPSVQRLEKETGLSFLDWVENQFGGQQPQNTQQSAGKQATLNTVREAAQILKQVRGR